MRVRARCKANYAASVKVMVSNLLKANLARQRDIGQYAYVLARLANRKGLTWAKCCT